jgi:hypothetical protein
MRPKIALFNAVAPLWRTKLPGARRLGLATMPPGARQIKLRAKVRRRHPVPRPPRIQWSPTTPLPAPQERRLLISLISCATRSAPADPFI